MLKGQAKTNYQRNYMRRRRANPKLKQGLLDPSVRPSDEYILAAMDYLDNAPVPTDNRQVRYEGKVYRLDAEGNIIYEE